MYLRADKNNNKTTKSRVMEYNPWKGQQRMVE